MRRVFSSVLSVLAVAGALVVVLISVSTLATDEGSREVGREGRVAIMAEATLSAASATRNATTQAHILEQGRAAGWVTEDVVTEAVASLNAVTGEFQRRTTELIARLGEPESSSLTASSAAFISSTRGVITALTSGIDTPVPRVTRVESDAYDAVVVDLVTARDSRVRGVLVAAESVGQAADAVRFLVVVVIPIVAMLAFRSVLRRRKEREALRAEVRHQTELNTQKDEFVANLSHELRTPLTGIYGFALALDESGFEDKEMAVELTSLIIAEAGELSRMVDDLITAGQIETGNFALDIEDTDVDPVIEMVVEPYIRAGTDIKVTPGGFSAEVDVRRFQQAMRTLVSNAVRHGGPRIEVFSEHGAGMVSVFVMDDGDGIPDETVERIFERYVHEGTEPLLQGSVGLGLAIARSLAVSMGGSLTYTRTNGMTYFVLKAPSRPVSRLHDRVLDSDRVVDEDMYDTQEVAKLFAR